MRFKILLLHCFYHFVLLLKTTSDSSTTSTTVNEVSEEPSLESNSVDDGSENIDLYEYINHPLNYICDNSCIDNLTDTFVGNVKGELVVLIENEIISDIDYMSDNKILITGHNSGIIYKHEISSNLTTVWFDITSLTIVNGSQETGIHNIEISKNLKNLYISYTNKSNRFIISKFLVVDGVPSLESEIILVNENHISPAHYCGSLFLDEDNERLFGCLGDSQLDQLSLVNWNLHGSIFSIDTNTGDAHILNPKPNEEVEFSKDAVMRIGQVLNQIKELWQQVLGTLGILHYLKTKIFSLYLMLGGWTMKN